MLAQLRGITRATGILVALAASSFTFLAPVTASAQEGLFLYWDNCSPAGQKNKSFACDTDVGIQELVAAFSLRPVNPEPGHMTNGLIADLEIGGGSLTGDGTFTEPLPPYWRLEAGGCRAGAAVVSFDFGSPPFDRCYDTYWQGEPTSQVVSFTYPYVSRPGAMPSLLIRVTVSWPPYDKLAFYDRESYAFRLQIDRSNTTGPDACSFCCSPVTANLRSVTVLSPSFNIPVVGLPSNVIWNESPSPLCDVTATYNSTWGQLKGLYR